MPGQQYCSRRAQMTSREHRYVYVSPIACPGHFPSCRALPARCAPPCAFHFPIRNDPALCSRIGPARPQHTLKFPQKLYKTTASIPTHCSELSPRYGTLNIPRDAEFILNRPARWLSLGPLEHPFRSLLVVVHSHSSLCDPPGVKYVVSTRAPSVLIGNNPARIPPLAPAPSNRQEKNPFKWKSVTNTCASLHIQTWSTIGQQYDNQKMRTYNSSHLLPASAQLPQCSIVCRSGATTCRYHIQSPELLERFTSSLGKAAQHCPIYFPLFVRIFRNADILFV